MKKNKSGISLVFLAITIVVLVIIAGAGITVTNNMINNSKKVAFADDLRHIQDLVKEYYVSNGTLPVVNITDGSLCFTKEQFLQDQQELYRSTLESEMEFNYDESETNLFYQIDLSKIGVESSTRGTGTIADRDIYVMSKDTMTVYYYKGYIIDDIIYYSITDKIADVQKVEKTDSDNSTIIVTDVSDIKVKKSTELMTNSITITITGTLETGDSLRYKLYDSAEYITIDTLPTTISVNASSFASQNELNNFSINKKMIIENITTNQIVYVDLSNLDVKGPNILNYTIDRTSTEFNVVKISATDLKVYYYEYITKIDEVGSEVQYYEIAPEITTEYLRNVGKKANYIMVDKSIQSIKLIGMDEAGNTTSIYLVDNIAVD